jgi:hypothetical protein
MPSGMGFLSSHFTRPPPLRRGPTARISPDRAETRRGTSRPCSIENRVYALLDPDPTTYSPVFIDWHRRISPDRAAPPRPRSRRFAFHPTRLRRSTAHIIASHPTAKARLGPNLAHFTRPPQLHQGPERIAFHPTAPRPGASTLEGPPFIAFHPTAERPRPCREKSTAQNRFASHPTGHRI